MIQTTPHRFPPFGRSRGHQAHSWSGSALIGMVVAILVFSILAAAIVPMVGSSGRQVGAADAATQAYLMAESGFRYGASQYLQAGTMERAKNLALENLDGNYTLADGNHGFELRVFSYFYEILAVNSIGPSQVQFKAHAPGTFPAGDITGIDPGLKIHIADRTFDLQSWSQDPADEDDNVTMVITSPATSFPRFATIYPVAVAQSVETIGSGPDKTYNIVCRSDHTRMFPLRNGRIRVGGVYRTYRYNDRDAGKLIDIRDPEAPYTALDSLTIPPADTEVILAPFVRLESTGIYGTGPNRTTRTVTYHTPLTLPETATQTVTFTDRFDDRTDWQDVGGNLTTVDTVEDNNALTVTATTTSGDDQGSLIAFRPTTPEAKAADFNATRRAARGFLNYETQLKIGYRATPSEPPLGYFPNSPLPAAVAGGLSFRLGDLDPVNGDVFNANMYGLSFLRGNDSLATGIPNEIIPLPDQRLIVLWRQTNGGADRQWLAYKEMADFFLNENFEVTNQFFQETGTRWDPEIGGRQHEGSTVNWYFGNETTHNYDFGGTEFGVIQSNPIVLPAAIDSVLTFWSWHETEFQRPLTHDLKQVYIRQDLGGGNLGPRQLIRTIDDRGPAPGDWYQERLDLSSFAGQTIRVEFAFDTVDSLNNAFEGWYVDEVRVFYPWPVQEDTLGVRLQEALVVPFAQGTVRIRRGDRVFGSTHFTSGTVIAPPMLTAGDWTEGNPARGTILLNLVAAVSPGSAFEDLEELLVIGGTGRAQVDGYDEATDRRANIIRAYYATALGGGTHVGNTNPLDRETEPYGRLGTDPNLVELQWPPDLDEDGNWTDDDGNWTTAEDYFRLIQWDEINSAGGPGLSAIPFTANAQGLITNAVIQSHEPDLVSPLIVTPDLDPEIGLHAFGAGTLNVFFDDFGIRLDVGVDDVLPSPVQQ